MLEGLDNIPWSELRHAYGSAEDVPGLIRNLASPESKVADDALSCLFGNIWHQDTVYEATSYAVPFMVEVLMRSETHHRPMLMVLLQSIADGSGYLAVHSPDDPEVQVEQRHVVRCHEAVNEHIRVLATLRQAPDNAVRQHVPSLLCSLRDGRAWIVTHALEQAGFENDPFTAANWLFAIAHCADIPNNWFKRVRNERLIHDPVVSLAISHLKLASIDQDQAREAAAEIASSFLNAAKYDTYFNQCGFTDTRSCGGLEGMFIYLVERLPVQTSRKLLKPVCETAPKLGHITAEMICEPLLRVVFNEKLPAKAADLTWEQKTLLKQVARVTNVSHADPTRSIFIGLQTSGVLRSIGIKDRPFW